MKIRSHTGNMVDARVGMVCNFTYVNGEKWKEKSPVIIREISDRDGGTIRYTDFIDPCYDDCFAAPCHFQMLSCPLQDGDLVEVNQHDGSWKPAMYSRNFFMMNGVPDIEVRHASPDLRDAPGYESGAASC